MRKSIHCPSGQLTPEQFILEMQAAPPSRAEALPSVEGGGEPSPTTTTNIKPVISATFDIGCLAELALREASKMPVFEGKDLQFVAVYYNNEDTFFEGIKVTAVEPEEEP